MRLIAKSKTLDLFMARTTFFHSCFGVFQGGGCRASALIGAYEEAVKRGVQFVEVAGTSAGSIVAALIGAGASPAQLTQFIKELDFKKFLRPADILNRPPFMAQVAKKFSPKLSKVIDLAFNLGLYSSREVEVWVERCLRVLLGNHQGPIPFKMLPSPTSIVATDILTRTARVWNQRLSPDESVAKAVRASCSIPIFFQPVDKHFVDGGVLSNLPTFVFENSVSGRPLSSRILAFVLQGDSEPAGQEMSATSYFSAIAGTVVDGAQDIQMRLQPNVHSIVIPTGNIKATDFDKITPDSLSTLLASGRKAASEFLDAELKHVREPQLQSAFCYDREDLYNRLTFHLDDDVKDVLISEFDTDFVYQIFPSLLLWKARGAQIRVLLAKAERKAADGAYRRRLLARLGIEVVETDTIPFRGYFINPSNPVQASAYVALPEATASQRVEAVIYDGPLHAAAIDALYNRLAGFFSAPPKPSFLPKLVKGSQDTLLEKLKTVAQYNKSGVTLSVETVRLSELESLASYVHEYKYRQLEHWIPEFQRHGLPLFEPADVWLLDDHKSAITPPVVEESGDKFVLIEGSTRATLLREQGVERMTCVVVRGINVPLPGTVTEFAKIRVVGRRMDTDIRYDKFNYALFRKIEMAAHPLNSLL